ncbi:MAG: RNase adapter RapZ [Bdellovibrionota bacterium]
MMEKKKSLVIVSGLAGSGKTIALRVFEDSGYYCIDNLPAVLLKTFINDEVLSNIHAEHIALALDSRDFETPQTFQSIYFQLKDLCDIKVVYLTSSEEIISKRFRETRRQHPLTAKNSSLNLHKAIKLDEKTLTPIKKLAQRILDTSDMSVQSLKRFIYHNYAPFEESKHIVLNLVSFGFKHGVPADIDSMFDVRCFKNPYYEESLRHLTGKEVVIKDYVFSDKNVPLFIDKVSRLVGFFYPLYQEEGKRYFAIGIGCTGGKHRSVVIAEELAKIFRGLYPFVSVDHRHLDRE